jgi:hypothetical protein
VVLETLVPTPAYMRGRYQVKPGWPIWPYYVYRWFDQARDVCFAMWKRISGYR